MCVCGVFRGNSEIPRKGAHMCAYVRLLRIFARSAKIFGFLGPGMCSGSPQRASEKLKFCKIQAEKIDFLRGTFLFLAKFCYRVSFLSIFLTEAHQCALFGALPGLLPFYPVRRTNVRPCAPF